MNLYAIILDNDAVNKYLINHPKKKEDVNYLLNSLYPSEHIAKMSVLNELRDLLIQSYEDENISDRSFKSYFNDWFDDNVILKQYTYEF